MIKDCESQKQTRNGHLNCCMGSMFKTTGNKGCLFTTEDAKRGKGETAQEDVTDTNPWGRVPYTRRNKVGHWK